MSASLAYYFDSREFNTAQIHLSSKSLPAGFLFWGFTDFHSDQNDPGRRYRVTRSFSEYRLSSPHIGRWAGIDGLGLQLEYNRNTPADTNLTRMGITYKHALALRDHVLKKSWLLWRYFPYENDNDGYQASLSYFIKISEAVRISGFADRNVKENGDVNWIVEPQLNIRLNKYAWLLFEYRYNEFEENSSRLDGTGVAMGFKVDFF